MTWTPARAEDQKHIASLLAEAWVWAHSYYLIEPGTWSAGLVQDFYLDALSDLRKKRVSRDQLISVAGAAFGQLFVETLGYSWGFVQDEHGFDYAVSDRAGSVVFPMAAVAKRIDTPDPAFVGALLATFRKPA